MGHVSSAESQGIGIRVLANGCWGFAATDDLTSTASRVPRHWRWRSRVQARRRAPTKLRWRRKEAFEAVWTSPMQVDPFTVPVDRSLAVLLAVDKELRRNPGVSLAEASMQFENGGRFSSPPWAP